MLIGSSFWRDFRCGWCQGRIQPCVSYYLSPLMGTVLISLTTHTHTPPTPFPICACAKWTSDPKTHHSTSQLLTIILSRIHLQYPMKQIGNGLLSFMEMNVCVCVWLCVCVCVCVKETEREKKKRLNSVFLRCQILSWVTSEMDRADGLICPLSKCLLVPILSRSTRSHPQTAATYPWTQPGRFCKLSSFFDKCDVLYFRT